jgi:hypothetical protein
MSIILKKFKFQLKDYKIFDSEFRKVHLFDNKSCDELLEEFSTTLKKAIAHKKHLPIIRVADGEFQFLLGKNEFNTRKPFLKLIIHMVRQYAEGIFKPKFEAKSRTYTSGIYSSSDRENVKEQYAKCLRHISNNGILALYTIIKPKFYTEQYLPKLFSFFDSENIHLNKDNYVPFYFIYIILTNPKYSYVYKDKNLHLITSFNMKRKLSIESTMKSLGVKSVSWTQISRDKSLFDKIDESKISDNVDIIFVGAGIGKVNIFNQLKNTQSLIIDAGYIFETWEDPSLVSERDYCETSD